MPVSQTNSFARAEAFNSTGRVTNWKSTTSANRATPNWTSPAIPSRNPPSRMIQEALEAKLAGRASAQRIMSGW